MFRLAASAVLSLAAIGAPALASAQATEIYKCLDENGRPLYTSDKRDTAGKRCELVSREVQVSPAPAAPAAKPGAPPAASASGAAKSPPGFPKETPNARANAREKQREILERELEQERAMLEKARQVLAQQEATRDGSERNYARVQERLQPYKDSVEVHQKNVEALERELRNLFR